MVRATAAEVLKLFGGSYPPGTSAANIADLCAQADYILDTYVKSLHKGSLSTTDTGIINIANEVVARIGMRILWYQAGGILSNTTEPEPLTPFMRDMIEAALAGTGADDPATTLDGIDEEDT